MQRASMTRRREYPEEDGDNDGSRRPHRNWRLPDRGRYPNQGGRPLTEENTLMEDPLVMEDLLVMDDPLDLLVDKDHQALKDNLDQ